MDIKLVTRPTQYSEFEIQAFVYIELLRGGFQVYGESKTRQKNENGRMEQCRFDISEFKDAALCGIIEIKSDYVNHKLADGWLGTRQGRRYSSFGVPIALIYGMDQAIHFVDLAKDWDAIPYVKFAPQMHHD